MSAGLAWTPAFDHSGVTGGGPLSDALRRQVAWLELAREQLDHGRDIEAVERELEEVVRSLLRLSLEIEHIEFTLDHERKEK